MSRPLDKLIEHEIDTINDHLPLATIPLKELAASEEPKFVTRAREESVFRKEEIIWLSEYVPSELHEDIRLPIIILRRMDQGRGIHTVAGNKIELFLVHKVIGYVDLEWSELASWTPVEVLARIQVQVLRRRLPSTTTIGIVLTKHRRKTSGRE
ncbi:MAG: DUF61 family protein [Candidatus Thorarchaeota archaeon]|nr:MAG: hypothetical protein DRP09_04255 [Candidatus Thorarchaeota archaeon]RLI60162.1 MAG: hypothetical protein DRO87_00510 [Candidatus Thorarchaeota archaeon]